MDEVEHDQFTEKVLDNGFVKLLNVAGPNRRQDKTFDADDTDPASSARVSFDQRDISRSRDDDLRLAGYLMQHRHTTPFEMIEVWMEMRIPIFVARQFVRHRTASINEVSGRYATLKPIWYIPDPDKVGVPAPNKKQGRDIVPLDWMPPKNQANILVYLSRLNDACKAGYDAYRAAMATGIPAELARLNLHVNHYTHWLWKQDLHNLMHLLDLREAPDAQYEAQRYAKAISQLLSAAIPDLMALRMKLRPWR